MTEPQVQLNIRTISGIAEAVAPATDPLSVSRRWATVTGFNADNTVNIYISGIHIEAVPRDSTYRPRIGDRVRVDVVGTDMTVVGSIGETWEFSRTTTNIAVAAAGWALTASSWVRRAALGHAVIYLEFTYTGAGITVQPDGNINENPVVCTLNTPWRPFDIIPMTSSISGPMAVGYARDDGGVVLAATTPGATITNGKVFSLAANYPLA